MSKTITIALCPVSCPICIRLGLLPVHPNLFNFPKERPKAQGVQFPSILGKAGVELHVKSGGKRRSFSFGLSGSGFHRSFAAGTIFTITYLFSYSSTGHRILDASYMLNTPQSGMSNEEAEQPKASHFIKGRGVGMPHLLLLRGFRSRSYSYISYKIGQLAVYIGRGPCLPNMNDQYIWREALAHIEGGRKGSGVFTPRSSARLLNVYLTSQQRKRNTSDLILGGGDLVQGRKSPFQENDYGYVIWFGCNAFPMSMSRDLPIGCTFPQCMNGSLRGCDATLKESQIMHAICETHAIRIDQAVKNRKMEMERESLRLEAKDAMRVWFSKELPYRRTLLKYLSSPSASIISRFFSWASLLCAISQHNALISLNIKAAYQMGEDGRDWKSNKKSETSSEEVQKEEKERLTSSKRGSRDCTRPSSLNHSTEAIAKKAARVERTSSASATESRESNSVCDTVKVKEEPATSLYTSVAKVLLSEGYVNVKDRYFPYYMLAPINQDASSSAYQIMSYFLLNEEMAMRTNLLPSPDGRIQDLYACMLEDIKPYLNAINSGLVSEPGDLSFAKAVKRSGRLYFVGLIGLVRLIEEPLTLLLHLKAVDPISNSPGHAKKEKSIESNLARSLSFPLIRFVGRPFCPGSEELTSGISRRDEEIRCRKESQTEPSTDQESYYPQAAGKRPKLELLKMRSKQPERIVSTNNSLSCRKTRLVGLVSLQQSPRAFFTFYIAWD
ncbi:DNA-directed RNA polymerase [Striga asiatica]|uniref:DNA-directed RNA polymerase n=1 Tax=Striga asiatica TaxID=4170 RepID=A0A5A7Q263_STRAF|nr:DNA-directed RNA polymerase [Striga asiatica]